MHFSNEYDEIILILVGIITSSISRLANTRISKFSLLELDFPKMKSVLKLMKNLFFRYGPSGPGGPSPKLSLKMMDNGHLNNKF